MANNGSDNRYMPGTDFNEDNSGPSLPISLSDSTELWLIQWPLDQLQPVDFNRKTLSLKLCCDGKLGSFENSSGKSFEVVSFSAQKPDATVFLHCSSGSKVVGKISRRACLVHYPEPGEFDKPAVSGLKTSGSKFQCSMMKKLSHLSSIHNKTSSTGADRSTETPSGGHSIGRGIQETPIEQSRRKRHGVDPTTASVPAGSIERSSLASKPESQLTYTTIGSKQSHGKKAKTKKLKS
ncbi:hypothetical protein KSP40_PGU009200 [Platanthera guangdongensis]|uniref:Mediator-associated protein 2 n=1 Tax=Platanthera guangdongensis TaxID=2320717 RepID=A0ABR2LHD5_9ASPA